MCTRAGYRLLELTTATLFLTCQDSIPGTVLSLLLSWIGEPLFGTYSHLLAIHIELTGRGDITIAHNSSGTSPLRSVRSLN